MATLIHAEKGRQVTVPDDTVDYYLERGWHVAGSEPEAVVIPDGDPTDKWSRKELDAYAETLEIDVSGAKTKGDVLAAIVAAGEQEGETNGADAAEGDAVSADADGGAADEG